MDKRIKLVGLALLTCLALTACKKENEVDSKQNTVEEVIPEGLGQVAEKVWGDDMPLADSAKDPNQWVGGEETPIPASDVEISDSSEGYVDSEQAIAWRSSIIEDLINGNKMLYTNVSSNMHDIDDVFTEMVMFVREKPNSSYFSKVDYEVFFKVESGKFFCMDIGNCYLNTKIGGEPMRYYYSDEKSGAFNMVFVKSRGHFMDMMLKDDQLIVEASFLHNGTRQFVFDVSNFPGLIDLPTK